MAPEIGGIRPDVPVARTGKRGKRRSGTQQDSKRLRETVVREVKDLLLKRLGKAVPDTFLAVLGLDLPRVVEILPADLSVLEVRVERPDLLLRLADGSIAHIEFQTTANPGDLLRFYDYHVAISKQFECLVHTIVIYGPGIQEAQTFLDLGSVQYRVRNVYLGQRDGEELVARLRGHAAVGERWSAQEQVEAILLPLMGRRRPLPALLEEIVGASVVLAQAERTDVLGSMVGLAYNYLETGLAEQLLEVLRKMNAFEELLVDRLIEARAQIRAEVRAEVRAEGIAEGHAEGQRQAILQVLARRFEAVPDALAAQVGNVQDPARLTALFDAALDVENLDAFAQALSAVVPSA